MLIKAPYVLMQQILLHVAFLIFSQNLSVRVGRRFLFVLTIDSLLYIKFSAFYRIQYIPQSKRIFKIIISLLVFNFKGRFDFVILK
jgi:hypothetical protein